MDQMTRKVGFEWHGLDVASWGFSWWNRRELRAGPGYGYRAGVGAFTTPAKVLRVDGPGLALGPISVFMRGQDILPTDSDPNSR